MKTKKKKGFTLTELIVVIVIIGVLAAVMIPTLTGYITKAQNSKDETLVASLNRSYENTKIMDDIEIYTAYDVQAFLKEVDMENIEVANKSSIILFDTIEDKFVLVKEDEQNALVKQEFVTYISEYYKIKHDFYEDNNSGGQTINLSTSKLSSNCDENCETHRAFIVSINGNEISEAVETFMSINGEMDTDTKDGKKYLKESMINIFTKSYSDSKFKENLTSALFKTLFIDNVNGSNVYFYIDSDYQIVDFSGSNPNNQTLTRPTILSNVDEVDLSVIKDLSQCTIIVPGTVEEVKTSNMGTSNDVSGNVNALDDESKAISLEKALINPIVKEILATISEKVYYEEQLITILECYDGTTLIDKVKKQVSDTSIISILEGEIQNLTKTITIMDSFTITTTDIIIPEGVTLFIPYNYDDLDIGNYITYKKYVSNYLSNKTSSNKENVANASIPTSVNANGKGDNYFSKVNKTSGEDRTYLNCELIIGEGVTLKVNGLVIVSGITGIEEKQGLAGHTTGKYAQIKLESETSKIELGSTGVLDVYGYIIGKGKINTTNGSVINEPFVIGDFAGGTYSALLSATLDKIELNNNGTTTPFSQYGLVNIQTDIEIVYGATLGGFVKLHFNNTMNTNDKIPLSFISDSDGFLIMDEGSIVSLSYSNDNITETKSSFSNVGKTTIKINGKIQTGKIDVTLKVYDYPATLSSNDFLLPISYSFDIVFETGSSSISNDLALLPGLNMTIENGATLTIESGATLYVLDTLVLNSANKKSTIFSSPSFPYLGTEKSNFIVNGVLNIQGTFGGIIQTKQTSDNSATINVGNNATLNGTAKFGSGTKSIKILNYNFSFSSTSTMNNYSMNGYISTPSGLVELQKEKIYTSTYISDSNSYYKCTSSDTIKCWVAGDEKDNTILGSGAVVWNKSETSINRDGLTFYGDWTTTFTVTFYDRDSNMLDQKVVNLNDKIDKPANNLGFTSVGDMTYNNIGYYYDGCWYTNNDLDLGNDWNFESNTVTSNVDLYIGLRKYYSIIFKAKKNVSSFYELATINKIIEGKTIKEFLNDINDTETFNKISKPESYTVIFDTKNFKDWYDDVNSFIATGNVVKIETTKISGSSSQIILYAKYD